MTCAVWVSKLAEKIKESPSVKVRTWSQNNLTLMSTDDPSSSISPTSSSTLCSPYSRQVNLTLRNLTPGLIHTIVVGKLQRLLPNRPIRPRRYVHLSIYQRCKWLFEDRERRGVRGLFQNDRAQGENGGKILVIHRRGTTNIRSTV